MKNLTLKKIAAMLIMSVAAVAVIVLSATLSYRLAVANREQRPAELGEVSNRPGGGTDDPGHPDYRPPPDVNVLLLGIDENNLPDTMFYLNFSWETNAVNIVNIPRDSRVEVTQAQREAFAEIGRSGWVPDSGRFPLNELFTRAGGRQRNGHGLRFMAEHLQDLLGVEFDYHVIVDLRGFRNIVDAVDGIYMYVPYRLFYRGIQLEDGTWSRGTIDIDIPYGWQTLNGHQAEQVVRFRHGVGDLERIKLQQLFMEAFFEQVLTLEAVLSNPVTFASTLINHVDTNIGIPAIMEYNSKGILQALSANNINFHVIPIELGGRYFIIDEPAAKQLIQDIRNNTLKGDE